MVYCFFTYETFLYFSHAHGEATLLLCRGHLKSRVRYSLTTGNFIINAANAAEEVVNKVGDLKIPYWCTLKAKWFFMKSTPGYKSHKSLLEKEGFRFLRKVKNCLVQDFQDYELKFS